MSRPASEVMTEAVVHVDQTSPLTRVLQLMVSLKTRSFPVISADGHLVGMISREDVMRALEETTQEILIDPNGPGVRRANRRFVAPKRGNAPKDRGEKFFKTWPGPFRLPQSGGFSSR